MEETNLELEIEELSEAPDVTEETVCAEEAAEANEALKSEKLSLESEIAALKDELERAKAETDRKAKEYAEFRELFPYADPCELAPEVTEMVEEGIPLAAAYSLYEKRLRAKEETAKAHNKATREGGFGSVGHSTGEEYYTPDEVRAMTQTEVRKNYQKILRSMEKWH